MVSKTIPLDASTCSMLKKFRMFKMNEVEHKAKYSLQRQSSHLPQLPITIAVEDAKMAFLDLELL